MNAIRGMEAKVISLPYSGRVSGQPVVCKLTFLWR